jgi:hypothetical protein
MKHLTPPLSITRPIEISKNIPFLNEQHSIKINCFDPTQNSPPSVWKMRLNKRLGDSPIKYQH